MRQIIICLILITLCGFVAAQENGLSEKEQEAHELISRIEAVSDSLLQLRDEEVRSLFGFTDRDKLIDVANLLAIENMDAWKSYLKLEPANKALDNLSLRNLNISPYQALLAQQYSIHRFTELSTLGEIASLKNMPIKKLRHFLDIYSLDSSKDGFSLQALGTTPSQIDSLDKSFKKASVNYGVTLTAVGMLIVFSALLITSIVIGQLKHVNKKPKIEDRPLMIDRSGKLVSQTNIDPNIVVAAITALYLYQSGIQEQRKQMLTFKRTPTNQWRASQVMNMPNRELLRTRRSK